MITPRAALLIVLSMEMAIAMYVDLNHFEKPAKKSFIDVVIEDTIHRLQLSDAERKNSNYVKVDPPPFLSFTLPKGISFQVDCTASGHPVPFVNWIKDDQPIDEPLFPSKQITSTVAGEVRQTLFFDCITSRNEGVYACVAESNGKIKIKKHIKLSVDVTHDVSSTFDCGNANRTPKIITWYPRVSVRMHKSVVLPCVYDGYPIPTVSWTDKNNKLITNLDERFTVLANGALVMHNVTKGDIGMYACSVKNHLGMFTVNTSVSPVHTEN